MRSNPPALKRGQHICVEKVHAVGRDVAGLCDAELLLASPKQARYSAHAERHGSRTAENPWPGMDRDTYTDHPDTEGSWENALERTHNSKP